MPARSLRRSSSTVLNLFGRGQEINAVLSGELHNFGFVSQFMQLIKKLF